MATQDDAPEQTIRRGLERNGSTQVGTSAIAQAWALGRLDADDRRRIAAALQRAGVVVEPPLVRAAVHDTLHLSLAPSAAPAAAPPTDVRTEPEAHGQPTAKPARDATPPARDATPRARNATPPAGDPTPPARDATPPARDPTPPAEPTGRPLAGRLGALAIALMVLGAFAPWAKAIFVTDYGTDRAGWLVLAVAVVAGVLLLVHAGRGARSPMPLVTALLGTVAVAVVASELRELTDDQFVDPAWGVYAAFAGSAGLVACSIAQLVRRD